MKKEDMNCENCNNSVYLGDGAFLCTKCRCGEPVVVMEDFQPSDEFFYCNGTNWEAK